jgi:hypothetical protein
MSDNVVIAELPKNARETLRVTVGEFKGHRLIGLRVWAPGDGGPIPTKQGFAIAPEKLDALIEALIRARRTAIARGWLSADAPAR